MTEIRPQAASISGLICVSGRRARSSVRFSGSFAFPLLVGDHHNFHRRLRDENMKRAVAVVAATFLVTLSPALTQGVKGAVEAPTNADALSTKGSAFSPSSVLPGLLTLLGVVITTGASIYAVTHTLRENAREARRADKQKLADEIRAAEQKLADEKKAKADSLNTLRAALRAELTQLIETMRQEIEFASELTNTKTWIPAHDYFVSYRGNRNEIGLLDEEEAELLTAVVYIYQERLGYVLRRASDLSPDTGGPVGRNIEYPFENQDRREELIGNLTPILKAAEPAHAAISRRISASPPSAPARPDKRPTPVGVTP
jgi:hypothetical protein